MIIEILGVGGGNTPELGSSSFLIWNDDMSEAVLMDCGYMTYPRLKELENRTGRKREIIKKITSVAITHLHNDHAGSLGSLLSHCQYLSGHKIMLSGVGTLPAYLNLVENRASACIVGADERIKIIPTSHDTIDSCALYFDGVLYSGDTNASQLVLPEAKKAKIIIHEARVNAIPSHMNIDKLAADAPSAVRKKTWIIHYSTGMAEKIVLRAAELGFAGVLTQGQIINLSQGAS